AVEIDQRPSGVPRLHVGLRDPDAPNHEVLPVDVTSLRPHFAIDDRGFGRLVAASGITDRGPLGPRPGTGFAERGQRQAWYVEDGNIAFGIEEHDTCTQAPTRIVPHRGPLGAG